MNKIVYLTKWDGSIEVRTYVAGNPAHKKEFAYLMVKVSTTDEFQKVTIVSEK